MSLRLLDSLISAMPLNALSNTLLKSKTRRLAIFEPTLQIANDSRPKTLVKKVAWQSPETEEQNGETKKKK